MIASLLHLSVAMQFGGSSTIFGIFPANMPPPMVKKTVVKPISNRYTVDSILENRTMLSGFVGVVKNLDSFPGASTIVCLENDHMDCFRYTFPGVVVRAIWSSDMSIYERSMKYSEMRVWFAKEHNVTLTNGMHKERECIAWKMSTLWMKENKL